MTMNRILGKENGEDRGGGGRRGGKGGRVAAAHKFLRTCPGRQSQRESEDNRKMPHYFTVLKLHPPEERKMMLLDLGGNKRVLNFTSMSHLHLRFPVLSHYRR